jgi:hypothetical protein
MWNYKTRCAYACKLPTCNKKVVLYTDVAEITIPTIFSKSFFFNLSKQLNYLSFKHEAFFYRVSFFF